MEMTGLNPPIRWKPSPPPINDQQRAIACNEGDETAYARDEEESMPPRFAQDVCVRCVPILQTHFERIEEKLLLRVQTLVQQTEEREREILSRIEAKMTTLEPAPLLDVERVQALIADDLDVYNTHVQQLLEGVRLVRA